MSELMPLSTANQRFRRRIRSSDALRAVMSRNTTTAPVVSLRSLRIGAVVYSTGKLDPSLRQNTSSSTRRTVPSRIVLWMGQVSRGYGVPSFLVWCIVAHDVRRVDVLHQQVADDRVHERLDRGSPLAHVLDVGPLGRFRIDVARSALGEGLRRGARRGRRSPDGLLGFDGVDALANKLARSPRFLSGERKRNLRKAAQAHLGPASGERKAQQPTACLASDVKTQARDVSDRMKSVASQSRDCQRRQLSVAFRGILSPHQSHQRALDWNVRSRTKVDKRLSRSPGVEDGNRYVDGRR
jgi:hypothetical protein